MKPIVRNIIAVVLGVGVALVVNGLIIAQSWKVVAPPAGTDITTFEGLNAAMSLMEPKHFLMPFLAHALGSLFGAMVASLISANRKLTVAMTVGLIHFIGGFANVMMLPAPMWFNIADLTLAYFPMAFLGYRIFKRRKK